MKLLIQRSELGECFRVEAGARLAGGLTWSVRRLQAVQMKILIALAAGTAGLLCGCITTEEEIALRRLNSQRETHPAYYELERRRMMRDRGEHPAFNF